MRRLLLVICCLIVINVNNQFSNASVASSVPNPYARSGQASWYSRHDPGINPRTANNEYFDDSALTCAMWGVEFNRLVRVTNKANKRSIVLRVNDRGPNERFVRQGRIIDLTKAAFSILNPTDKGLIDVTVEFL